MKYFIFILSLVIFILCCKKESFASTTCLDLADTIHAQLYKEFKKGQNKDYKVLELTRIAYTCSYKKLVETVHLFKFKVSIDFAPILNVKLSTKKFLCIDVNLTSTIEKNKDIYTSKNSAEIFKWELCE